MISKKMILAICEQAKRVLTLGVALILLVVWVPALDEALEQPRLEFATGDDAPVRLLRQDLSFASPPPLNSSSDITYSVSIHPYIFGELGEFVGWAQVTLSIPQGFISVGNNTTWEGDVILDGDPTDFVWTLKAVETGNWTIVARIYFVYTVPALYNSDPRYEGVAQDATDLTVHVDVSDAWIVDTSYKEPETPPWYTPIIPVAVNDTYDQYDPNVTCYDGETIVPCPVDVGGQGASPPGPGPLAGWVKVIGCIQYTDPELGDRDARWVTAEIWDVNILWDSRLESVLVGSDGCFESSWISNDDEWGTKDIYVIFITASSAAKVHMDWGDLYGGRTITDDDVPDGIHDIETYTAGNHGGFRTYEYLMDGWEYMATDPPGRIPGLVDAYWEDGHGPQYGILCTCPNVAHFHIGGFCDKQIHLDSPDAHVPDTVLHEYGHFNMHEVYNGWFSPNWGQAHFLLGRSHVEVAWHEGFADFFPTMARADEYYSMLNDNLNFNEETQRVELITNPAVDVRNYDWGDDFEINVATALYDLTDSDDDDDFDGSHDLLWDVLESQTDASFLEFWNAWRALYGADLDNIHWAKTALFQNLIDYNDAPVAMNTRIVTPLPPSGCYDGVVTFEAFFWDSDPEDRNGHMTVGFQYFDGAWNTFDHMEDVTVADTGSWLQGDLDTSTVPDGTYAYRSYAFDDMETGFSLPSGTPICIRHVPAPIGSGSLQAELEDNLQDIKLTWSLSPNDPNHPSPQDPQDVIGYGIHRATSLDGPYQLLDTVDAGVDTYVDVHAALDPTSYFYTVVPYDQAGNRGIDSQERVGKVPIDISHDIYLFSLPLVPEDTSTPEVLKSVWNDFCYVTWYDPWDETWKSYKGPACGGLGGELTTLDEKKGIWISMVNHATLVSVGRVPEQTTIQLKTGWNLVGYPSFEERTIADVLDGVPVDRVEVFDPDSPPYYLRVADPSEFMQPAHGYWVLVSADSQFTVTNDLSNINIS